MERTERKTNGSGRALALGSTGLLAIATLVMALAPASAAAIHANTTLSAPYKGTVSSPNTYSSVSGCGAAKVLSPPKWAATSGIVTTSMSAKANTCAKVLGGVGAYSSGDSGAGMSIAVPFKVSSTGNHSIQSTWSLNLASAQTFSYAACPGFNVHYPPALYSSQYAYCEAGAELSVYFSAQVLDLSNSSWYGNYSYLDSYNDSYYENYTDCYNYGTPTCYNTSGAHSYAFTYGYHDAGVLTLNGASVISMWTNGTGMVASHHYVLEISISIYAYTYAEQYNLLGHWTASASASMNAATLGNGAKLSSVVIS